MDVWSSSVHPLCRRRPRNALRERAGLRGVARTTSLLALALPDFAVIEGYGASTLLEMRYACSRTWPLLSFRCARLGFITSCQSRHHMRPFLRRFWSEEQLFAFCGGTRLWCGFCLWLCAWIYGLCFVFCLCCVFRDILAMSVHFLV